MATIGLTIAPLAGPINASRRLVKDLVARGHRVFYTGIPDCREFVRSMPAPFVPVFEHWFPDGTAAPREPRPRTRGNPALRFFRAVLEDSEPSYYEMLREQKPDLMLLPSCFRHSTMCALMCHRLGVPSVYVTSIFLRFADRYAGPITSDHVPTGRALSMAAAEFAWLREGLAESARQTLMRVMHGMNIRTFTNRLADLCGYPRDLLVWRDLFAPRILAPDLVLYPKCLDLPGGERPGRYYASASIDLDRSEPPFPWERLSRELPLALCAMGTVRYLSPDRMKKLLSAIIAAAGRIRPGHQFVVATGQIDPRDFESVPDNVLLERNIPQLSLLARASIMITHGGANSVKECAYFGVPMVVFPLALDQPASCARVEYHGLGRAGSVKDATPERVQELVETVLRVPFYRLQSARMRDRIAAEGNAGKEMELIEAALERRGQKENWREMRT